MRHTRIQRGTQNSGGPARWVFVVRVIRQQIILVEWRLVSDIKRNWTPDCNSRGLIRQVRKFTRAGLELVFDREQVYEGSNLSLMAIPHAHNLCVKVALRLKLYRLFE